MKGLTSKAKRVEGNIQSETRKRTAGSQQESGIINLFEQTIHEVQNKSLSNKTSSDCHMPALMIVNISGFSGCAAPCCHGHIQPRDMRIEARGKDTRRRFGVVGNVGLAKGLKIGSLGCSNNL